MLAHNCKKAFVQHLAETLFPVMRMHTNEVNIGFIRPTLREKADQESHDLVIFFEDETGFAEVFEEQSR